MLDQVFGKTPGGWLESARQAHLEKLLLNLPKSPLAAKPVPEVTSLTRERLIESCFKQPAPLVFRQGAKNWPCMKTWSLDFFADHYGETKVISFDDTKEITLKDLCQNVKSGGTFTMKFHPLVDFEKSLQQDVNWPWFRSMEVGPAIGHNSNLFITGAGATDLHGANVCNLFVQVTGKKTWWIYPPEATAFLNLHPKAYHWASPFKPAPWQTESPLERVEHYKVDLEPGDILYNPPYFWHYVHTWEPSIAVAYKWINFSHCLKISKSLTIAPFFCKHSTLRGLFAKSLSHEDQIRIVDTLFKFK